MTFLEQQESQIKNLSEDELWDIWSRTKDKQVRDKLVAYYRPWIKKIAEDMFLAISPEGLGLGDFLHYATLGLLESIDRFDHTRDIAFTHFARLRIRGAISSYVAKPSERDIATDFALQERNATDSDIDDPLLALVDFVNELVIDELLFETETQEIEESLVHDAYVSVEMENMKTELKTVVGQLNNDESTIIHYHYFHHLNFNEIAKVMELSKGRVSQIHKSALNKIKQRFGMRYDSKD